MLCTRTIPCSECRWAPAQACVGQSALRAGSDHSGKICSLNGSLEYDLRSKEVSMATSTALASVIDVESFINEYFGVWQGTDEDRIMSYYAENVAIQFPGRFM